MMVGGDKLDYEGEPSSPVFSLLNTNIFLNSVISDARKGARFASADINKIITYKAQCTLTNTCTYHSRISLLKYVENMTS